MATKKKEIWIQDALSGGKNKGALKRTALRKGLIHSVDEKLSKTDLHKLEKVKGTTSKRAYLAETLSKFEGGGQIVDYLYNGRYITLGTLPYKKGDANKNGNLKIELNEDGIEVITDMRENDECDDCIMNDLFDDVRSNSELMYFGDAGEAGFGLTEAPCITDGYYYNDDGELTNKGHKDSQIYYFNEYMIDSFIDKLLENGYVVFQRAESESDKYRKGGEVGTKVGGRGWGDFEKGRKITDIKDLKVGKMYLNYSKQFNSKNIILITSGDKTMLKRDIVYGSFVRPNNLKHKEEDFSIWGDNLSTGDYYEIEGKKYEGGGSVGNYFVRTKFNSHENHNPDYDIMEGYIDRDTFITYAIKLNGDNAGKESMEYYTGGNYVVGSNKKSSSRHFEADKIPSKYKAQWLALKELYESEKYAFGGSVKNFFGKAKSLAKDATKHAKKAYKVGSKHASKAYEVGSKHAKVAYEATKKHSKEAYDKSKEYVDKKIHDQKKKIALEVLNDTGSMYGVTKKQENLIIDPAYNLVYEKYESGGLATPSILSRSEIESKLGRSLSFWGENQVVVDGSTYQKVFMRNEYKKVDYKLSDFV